MGNETHIFLLSPLEVFVCVRTLDQAIKIFA